MRDFVEELYDDRTCVRNVFVRGRQGTGRRLPARMPRKLFIYTFGFQK
jgi:hypothetical protein